MMLKLQRLTSDDTGTFGQLFLDGSQVAVTCERPPTGDHPCIDTGTYKMTKFNSPHNGKCFLLHDTEPRTNIEMHAANKPSQLLGCIAPGDIFGMMDGEKAVLNSHATIDKLYELLPDTCEIEII